MSLHPWNLTWFTWKEVPRKGSSSWKPSFSGSMLNFGGVLVFNESWLVKNRILISWFVYNPPQKITCYLEDPKYMTCKWLTMVIVVVPKTWGYDRPLPNARTDPWLINWGSSDHHLRYLGAHPPSSLPLSRRFLFRKILGENFWCQNDVSPGPRGYPNLRIYYRKPWGFTWAKFWHKSLRWIFLAFRKGGSVDPKKRQFQFEKSPLWRGRWRWFCMSLPGAVNFMDPFGSTSYLQNPEKLLAFQLMGFASF